MLYPAPEPKANPYRVIGRTPELDEERDRPQATPGTLNSFTRTDLLLALVYPAGPPRVDAMLNRCSSAVEHEATFGQKTSIIVMADGVRAVLPAGFLCGLDISRTHIPLGFAGTAAREF
jgi:hypothetical protein